MPIGMTDQLKKQFTIQDGELTILGKEDAQEARKSGKQVKNKIMVNRSSLKAEFLEKLKRDNPEALQSLIERNDNDIQEITLPGTNQKRVLLSLYAVLFFSELCGMEKGDLERVWVPKVPDRESLDLGEALMKYGFKIDAVIYFEGRSNNNAIELAIKVWQERAIEIDKLKQNGLLEEVISNDGLDFLQKRSIPICRIGKDNKLIIESYVVDEKLLSVREEMDNRKKLLTLQPKRT